MYLEQGEVRSIKGLEHIPVVPVADALEGATLVVLAIPATAHSAFVSANRALLHSKIIVDVSNPSPAEVDKVTKVKRERIWSGPAWKLNILYAACSPDVLSKAHMLSYFLTLFAYYPFLPQPPIKQ